MIGFFLRSLFGSSQLQRAFRMHFKGIALTDLVTASREFPITSRVDVQAALEDVVTRRGGAKLLGIHSPMNQETPTMAHLLTRGPFPMEVGPLQHDEVPDAPIAAVSFRWRATTIHPVAAARSRYTASTR